MDNKMLEKEIDAIDAAIFSSDFFHNPVRREDLISKLERWRRGLKEVANVSPKLDPLPEYGDLITLEEFSKNVIDGMFIPYDGDGYLATKDGMSREHSCWSLDDRPEWATHVMWFNK